MREKKIVIMINCEIFINLHLEDFKVIWSYFEVASPPRPLKLDSLVSLTEYLMKKETMVPQYYFGPAFKWGEWRFLLLFATNSKRI